MLDSVFTYGTLQNHDVMMAVTGKSFARHEAVLPEFRRYRIKKRTYPAIVADESATTTGVLYTGVDEQSLLLLDRFEDVLYDRRAVEVKVNSQLVKAYAYILNDRYRHRLDEIDWDLQEFEQNHLPYYLTRIDEL